jgi:hypothetical protein
LKPQSKTQMVSGCGVDANGGYKPSF